DPGTVRRMDHQLHSARFIEKTLHDQSLLSRDRAKDAMCPGKVLSQLPRSSIRNACLGDEPISELGGRWKSGQVGRWKRRLGKRIPPFPLSHFPTFACVCCKALFNLLS